MDTVKGDEKESGYPDKGLQSETSELYCEGTDSPLVGHNKGWVRWLANAMQLVGYYMLIHDGFQWGLLIKGISDVLILVWAAHNKLYDVIVVTAIFCVFNFQRLYEVSQPQWWQLFFYKATSILHLS